MKKPLLIILLALVGLASCKGPRLIPEKEMSEIYAQIYLSDQWIMRNTQYRKQADTSLFYDAVLEKFGYTFQDYDYSVAKYIESPKQYMRIFDQTISNLNRRAALVDKYIEIEAKNREFDKAFEGLYEPSEFWPANYDSDNYSLNAKDGNSLRSNKKPKTRQLSWDQPAPFQR